MPYKLSNEVRSGKTLIETNYRCPFDFDIVITIKITIFAP
jgi:hypothetical protein